MLPGSNHYRAPRELPHPHINIAAQIPLGVLANGRVLRGISGLGENCVVEVS